MGIEQSIREQNREARVREIAEEIYRDTQNPDSVRNWYWACGIDEINNGVYVSPNGHKEFVPKYQTFNVVERKNYASILLRWLKDTRSGYVSSADMNQLGGWENALLAEHGTVLSKQSFLCRLGNTDKIAISQKFLQ